ncbi:metal-sulfur cluster biosynthetic enzyme [Actinoplanes lutulentus]|uniref:Metal-sulfur cluster biosynthetic enzyme n=1 Tax=Actinoplanes lutulentus TaxID=1287878 RepID=A0A327ZBP6_9ACTN|nr:metal-sulfur cluster assembly factor [Actinoplanes lutulentus]MBB2941489.1 metal-sulfur cluster biosynthetic enzyme [Actinoplanes lutulentus]RAK36979.1 metal-sulfur cluster biosynthetic enzyme [Actinoplanes lutulentus]
MSDKTDSVQTVATAQGSAGDAAADEVPNWLASERAEAAEAGEPVEVPATSVSEAAAAPAAVAVSDKPKPSHADIEEAMKDVVDPELGINVVDLGLVYGTHVDDDNVVTLDMTLTSAACPLTDVIEDQTRQALTTGPGGGLVQDFRINWVWLPPWGPDKITDDGREQLRALGFNV